MEILQTWAWAFLSAWAATGKVVAYIAGGLAAILMAAVVAAVIGYVCGVALAVTFDRITAHMAKRWKKRGRHPRGRWAEIIAEARE